MLEKGHDWKPSQIIFLSSWALAFYLWALPVICMFCQGFRIKRPRRKQVSLWRIGLFKSRAWVFILAMAAASVYFFKNPIMYCVLYLCWSKPRKALTKVAQDTEGDKKNLLLTPQRNTPSSLYDDDLAFRFVVGCIWKATWLEGKIISKQELTTKAGKVTPQSFPHMKQRGIETYWGLGPQKFGQDLSEQKQCLFCMQLKGLSLPKP